jgi:uncharacterized protein YlxP (DUF503 family)
MNVGVCKIRLHLPENTSLKEKRRVLKSITTQLKNRFNISVAEVDDHDLWQKAVLGQQYQIHHGGPVQGIESSGQQSV